MGRVIASNEAGMDEAAQRLQEGGLVAFPTETVYGLGADALNEKASAKIFEVKGRPASDPLIVHVLGFEDGERLVLCGEEQMKVARVLAGKLWPGPLTLVLPAAKVVPSLITAATGWVGIRSPAHPVARALLAASKLPLAAPSANRFNHVSPTKPDHVISDLGARDPTLLVVDGGASTVGIESTVTKVHPDHIEILRRGAVSKADLAAALSSAGLENVPIRERDTQAKPKTHNDAMEGPGQMLTHYAPNIPAYLLGAAAEGQDACVVRAEGFEAPIDKVVVIDFEGVAAQLENKCLAYRDLSSSGSATDAAAVLFDTLRWSEDVPGAAGVVLPSRVVAGNASADLASAIQDRLFRAASGRTATLSPANPAA